MTTELSRRDVIKRVSLFPLVGVLSIEMGCTTAEANQFINILNNVTLAVQGALPIISLFTPAPYNLLLPEIAGFINLANTAASSTASELASADTDLVRSQKILGYWATVVLNPATLAQLPTNVNNINTQALIQALVTYINNLLSQIAQSMPGVSVVNTARNAIVTISAPVALARRAIPAQSSTSMSFMGRYRLRKIVAQCDKNKRKLSGK